MTESSRRPGPFKTGVLASLGVLTVVVVLFIAAAFANGVTGWFEPHITWSTAERSAWQKAFADRQSYAECMRSKYEYWGVPLSALPAWNAEHDAAYQLFVRDCRGK